MLFLDLNFYEAEIKEMQLFPSGISNERKVKGTWVQYAATRKQKVGMLQILLDAG